MIKNLADIAPKSDYDAVQMAIRYLTETGASDVDVPGLSKALGMGERQLVALFQRWCGLTPKSFSQAVALNHAKRLLVQSASLLDTSLEVGFSSTARLYDLFVTHEAMPPGAWAKGGAGLTMRWGIAPSPFGQALLVLTEYGLAGLAFFDDGEEQATYADMSGRWPAAEYLRDDKAVAPIAQQIFNPGHWQAEHPIRIVLIGTDFEVNVWQGLLNIPLGQATTYGTLANSLGKPTAARAVGAAVGRNPISFVVPCHRVVGSTGKLTGYHWGLMRKRAMLGWEAGVSGAANP
jgi:AraC family transcriptional regulator of adaptative response/methylated-DNA-[protein]-cysteine methyltransferase